LLLDMYGSLSCASKPAVSSDADVLAHDPLLSHGLKRV
jgi:hypothetical protein